MHRGIKVQHGRERTQQYITPSRATGANRAARDGSRHGHSHGHHCHGHHGHSHGHPMATAMATPWPRPPQPQPWPPHGHSHGHHGHHSHGHGNPMATTATATTATTATMGPSLSTHQGPGLLHPPQHQHWALLGTWGCPGLQPAGASGVNKK